MDAGSGHTIDKHGHALVGTRSVIVHRSSADGNEGLLASDLFKDKVGYAQLQIIEVDNALTIDVFGGNRRHCDRGVAHFRFAAQSGYDYLRHYVIALCRDGRSVHAALRPCRRREADRCRRSNAIESGASQLLETYLTHRTPLF